MRYEDLDVYKMAFKLALEIHHQSQQLPKNEQYGGLADQIRRSSKSICANIAEGLSKHGSVAEERRFLGMAAGSAEETRVWCDFIGKIGYIPIEQTEIWREESLNIAKMLHSLMRKREG